MEAKANKKKAKKGIVVKSKVEKRAFKRLKEKEKKIKKRRRQRKELTIDADGDEVEEGADRDFDTLTDSVEFNEIVQAPPTLSKFKDNEGRKPGAKSNLLLGKMLTTTKKPSNMGKKKMKDGQVSMARQHMLDMERERVIEQYRNMKMNRMNKVKL